MRKQVLTHFAKEHLDKREVLGKMKCPKRYTHVSNLFFGIFFLRSLFLVLIGDGQNLLPGKALEVGGS